MTKVRFIALYSYKEKFMKTLKVTFREDQAYEKAHQYFIQTSGITGEKAKHAKMLKEAMKTRESGVDGINIRAEVSCCSSEYFKDHKIVIDGHELECAAFEQIDDEKVRGIYFYVITSGECRSSDENIMKLLYADIWGTAYVDAGRDLLKDYLEKDMERRFVAGEACPMVLSDSFGPGFYGMKMSAAKDIYQIFESDTVGIDLRESGVMVPLKSCIGLHLAVEEGAFMPGEECRDCIGNAQGCSYCRIKNNRAI